MYYLLTQSFDHGRFISVEKTLLHAFKRAQHKDEYIVGVVRQLLPNHWFGNFYDKDGIIKSAAHRVGTYTIQTIEVGGLAAWESWEPIGEIEYTFGDRVEVFIDFDPRNPAWVPGEVIGTEAVFNTHCYVVYLDSARSEMNEVCVWRYGCDIRPLVKED